MKVNFTVTNNNPKTIFNVLKEKLGREPSHEEIKAELRRILGA